MSNKQDPNAQTQGTDGDNMTAELPFEKCYLDAVGPLPGTLECNKYILTSQYDISNYVVAVPVETQDAETVANRFRKENSVNVLLTANPPNGTRRKIYE